jgi:hypothetical protein
VKELLKWPEAQRHKATEGTKQADFCEAERIQTAEDQARINRVERKEKEKDVREKLKFEKKTSR